MAKNPITWLEEEEIKVETPNMDSTFKQAKGFESAPSPVTKDLNNNLSTWFSPLDIKSHSVNIEKETKTIDTPKIDVSDTKIETPEIKTPSIETNKGKSTWIDVVDTEISKLREEKEKSIKDTRDSFNIAKWQFEKEKWLYKNFDDVNTKFENVLWEIRKIQTDQNITDLTDEQLQVIATNNWLTLEEIKNPTSIFNTLELTDEWKEKKWVTDAEDSINKIETDFNRAKEDLKFNLEWQVANLNNQISDVERQLKRNIWFAEAQWAFTGWFKSSGFSQGIKNIKNDWERTISRLKTLLERVRTADSKNVARLTEDYNNATTKAKKDLDSQLEVIRSNNWLQLNWLTDKYWKSTKELTNALNKIKDEFWTKSMKVFWDYINNMRSIQNITNDNIIQQEKINSLVEAKWNKRYNELLSNNWTLLLNTWLKWLQEELQNGNISFDRLKDLQNIQLNSITSTLWDMWNVNTADLQTIQALIKQGKTPTEIVAQMQSMDKFKAKVKDWSTKRFDLWGGRIRIENPDWTIEEFQDWKEVIITPTSLGSVDFTTNKKIQNKYAWEASFKNNNPAWITFNLSQNGKNLLNNAWINFTVWSARPKAEWGNYIKFNTVEDGINAQKVLLSEAWSNDIRARLEQWVWTSEWPTYATDLMQKAWIPEGSKFSDLSDDQLDTLVAVQMQRESPNFYNELVNSFETVPDEDVPELTAKQKIQWDALATNIYWKRAGTKPENQQKIYDLLAEWMTIDEVEDTIRLGGFWTEFTWDIKSSFDNISVWFSTDKNTRAQAILEDKVKDFGWSSSQVKNYLKRIARESMDADSEKKVKWYESLEKAMTDIRKDLKEFENSGWETDIFEGKVEWLFKRVWTVDDPELRKIATKIAKTIQVYRQWVSGAAFTESESQEYKNIFPSIDNVEELNSALIDAVLESNDISIDSAYSQQMWEDEYNNIFKPTPTLGSQSIWLSANIGSIWQWTEKDIFNSLYK